MSPICTNTNSDEELQPTRVSEACRSDHEQTWILGNITGFTLEVGTATGLVKWPSLTNETTVETSIVYANITSYPEL
jgi:hypothetical protein